MGNLPVSSSYGLPDQSLGFSCIPCEINKRKKTPCCPKYLEVSCGHSDRSFKLNLFGSAPTRDGSYVIQVIPDSDAGDSMVCNTSYGGCKKEKSSGKPYLIYSGPNAPVSSGPQSVKFCVYSPNPLGKSASFLDAIDLFFDNTGKTCNTYRVSMFSCDGYLDPYFAIIESFPKKKISGKLDLSVSFNRKEKKKYKLEKYVDFEISGSLNISIGNASFSLVARQATKKNSKSKYPDLFKGIEKFLGFVYSKLSFFEKIEVTPPKISFECSLVNSEKNDKYNIYNSGEVQLAFDPLLGFDFKIDILDYLLKFGGPVGTALSLIKKQLSKGVGGDKTSVEGDIKVELSAKAEIKGTIGWSFSDGSTDTNGEINTPITFSLAVSAYAKGKFLNMYAGAFASGTAKSTIGCRYKPIADQTKPNVTHQLYWSGLEVCFESYVELGEEISRDDESIKNTKTFTHVIAEGFSWPEQEKTSLLTNAI